MYKQLDGKHFKIYKVRQKVQQKVKIFMLHFLESDLSLTGK